MSVKIKYEKKCVTKKINSNMYEFQMLSLIVNNALFDPDEVSKKTKKIEEQIYLPYWRKISMFYLNGSTMIVKLSGLHCDLDDIKKMLGESIYERNIIFHHHRWVIDLNGIYDDEKFVLIECDKKLFKKLFKKYWFALGFELRFEGIVIEPKDVPYFERWSRRAEGKQKDEALLKKSLLYFDNQENGFHYRVYIRR